MPRYRRLGYVALNVSDLDRARAFYEHQLGLQASGEGPDGAAFFRCGFAHHDIALYRGAAPGLNGRFPIAQPTIIEAPEAAAVRRFRPFARRRWNR